MGVLGDLLQLNIKSINCDNYVLDKVCEFCKKLGRNYIGFSLIIRLETVLVRTTLPVTRN